MNTGRTHFKKGQIPWNKGTIQPRPNNKVSITCKCGNVKLVWPYQIKNVGGKFCSYRCAMLGTARRKGKRASLETKNRISLAKTTNSRNYSTLHKWIVRIKGRASYCSNNPLHKSKRFEWSNNSGQYLRDVDDYESLCIPCHRKKDRRINVVV